MAHPNDGTGAGLEAFLEWLAERGEVNPSTAKGFRATVSAVLALEPDPAQVKVRDIDVSDMLDRFETLKRTDYSTESMKTYRSRFRQSVAMYLAWLENDPNWKNAGRITARPAGATNGANRTQRTSRTQRSKAAKGSSETPEPPGDSPTVKMIAYDMPLRPELLIRIVLPVDLTPADADRVAAFVRSLAFTPVPVHSTSPPPQPDEPVDEGG